MSWGISTAVLHNSGFRVKDRKDGVSDLPPHLKKATEARHVSRVSLNGGLERPLCEAVNLKPGLP